MRKRHSRFDYPEPTDNRFCSVVSGAVMVAGSIAQGAMSASAAGDAAQAQKDANATAIAQQQQGLQQVTQQQQPWMDAGTGALKQLVAGTQAGGQFNKPFTPGDLTQDPGYQFQLSQGNKAITAGAAAKGQSLSPATLQALSQFNQGLAGTTYNNAFERNMQQNQFTLGALQNVAGMGQSATNTLTNATMGTSNNISNLDNNAGNIAASGIMGQANAWNSAIGGVTSAVGGMAGGGGGFSGLTNMFQPSVMQGLATSQNVFSGGNNGWTLPSGEALPT